MRPVRLPPLARVVGLVIAAVVAPAPVIAAEEPVLPEDVFSFSVESDAELVNDRMVATLVAEGEAEAAATLADEINRTMRWALERLAEHETVRGTTRDYTTWPRHDTSQRRRLIGWRGSQTLELESEDFAAMGQVIGALQERLQVRGTALSVRPETRRAATDALIEEALEAFRQRAVLVQRSFGARGHAVLDVDIRPEGVFVEPPMMRGRMLAMESADGGVAEPGIAAGTSRVTVQVSGRIRLER